MDDALVHKLTPAESKLRNEVLILVVMDDALVPIVARDKSPVTSFES